METQGTPSECAAKGAALLDVVRPHWHEVVSVGSLQMTSHTRCVLGQLYGRWQNGLLELFAKMDGELSDRYGFSAFCAGSDNADCLDPEQLAVWDALNVAWLNEIARRRAHAMVEPVLHRVARNEGVLLSA
jgi:hypothetical protein